MVEAEEDNIAQGKMQNGRAIRKSMLKEDMKKEIIPAENR